MVDALWVPSSRAVGFRSALIVVVILHVSIQGILGSECLITVGFLAGNGPVPGSWVNGGSGDLGDDSGDSGGSGGEPARLRLGPVKVSKIGPRVSA